MLNSCIFPLMRNNSRRLNFLYLSHCLVSRYWLRKSNKRRQKSLYSLVVSFLQRLLFLMHRKNGRQNLLYSLHCLELYIVFLLNKFCFIFIKQYSIFITTIISIAWINCNIFQFVAIIEGRTSYTCHTAWYLYTG